MKATFARSTLLSGISLIQNSVSPAGTLPILANVLIEATARGVELIATDLETFSKVTLEARVEEQGRTTVPAKTLADIVRLLPDDDVAIVSTGNRLTLTCNRNIYHLSTMSADDYPEWPKADALKKITLKQADLKRLLRSTMFAIPTKDPRKVLMGALFQLTKDGLVCVATDGRKLGKATAEPVEVKGKGKDGLQAIIPGRVLAEIDKAIGDEGEIEIGLSERQAVFTVANLTYLATLIEGNFPKYDSVIPDSFKRAIELPKGILLDAITRAAVLAERKYNSIILSFEKNLIEISAQSFEDGSYEGQVEIAYTGEPFKIAFSHQYLQEVFKIAPDAILRMKVKDSAAPVVFECDSDPTALFLVMPVRMHDLEGEDAAEGDEE